MYKFRNIDSFRPQEFEEVGELKGKRWYIDAQTNRKGLFKPQRHEFKDRKVFCANHYGEFVGSVIATKGGNETCKTELAHNNQYYSNIYKERNGATPEEKDGCIIYCELEEGDNLEPGEVTIEKFKEQNKELFEELTKNDQKISRANDNIEVILASVECRVREGYEEMIGEGSEDYIQSRILVNKKRIINQMVYDCLYGNYDRHDENWSMRLKKEGEIDVYPMYDNERVLGLYENLQFIENAIKQGTIKEISEEKFFSRMMVPGEKKKNSTYKDVLDYLVDKYPEETIEAIKRETQRITPVTIREILENCERLPQEYIEFGSEMYKYRYDFARELVERNKKNIKEEPQKREIKSIIDEER